MGGWGNDSGCASLAIASQLREWPTQDFDRLLQSGCNCSQIWDSNKVTNLYCSPFPFYPSWYMQVLYIFLFTLTISSAVVGNSVVLWVILGHRKMRTVTNYFLMNLAFADLSISIFNVCFQFQFNLYFNWFFGSYYCVFSNFMSVAPTCASVFTMVSMSLDRYMAIVYPLRPRLSKRKTIGAVALIWVLATLCGLPHAIASRTNTFFFYNPPTETYGSSYHYYYESTTCIGDNYVDGDAATSTLYAIYNNFLLCITYLIPLFVLTITYTLVGRELWGAQSIGEHGQEDSIRAKRKVVKMMIVIVSVFMVCWLPYHLYFTVLVGAFSTALEPMVALYVYLNIYWLAMSSTVFNPLICAYMNTRFRMGFAHVFRWLPFTCVRTLAQKYSESELCRDPRRVSVSGLYRLRSLNQQKKKTRTVRELENGKLLHVPESNSRPSSFDSGIAPPSIENT